MSKEETFFHMNRKTIPTGKVAERARYVNREGHWSARGDLIAKGWANFPPDAPDPTAFCRALDRNERKNGGATEYVVALPRSFSNQDNTQLGESIARRLAGPSPCLWGVHCPTAALESGSQPHVHALVYHKVPDGIPRDLGDIFSRHNPDKPERGGWRKDSGGDTKTAVSDRLRRQRATVAAIINDHLAQRGSLQTVDHRSYEEQGVDKVPTKHLGPTRVRRLLDARRIDGQF